MAVVTMVALFSEEDLRRLAGERSFGRGLGYLDEVADLEIGVDQVTATVYGTDAYEIVLTLDADSLTGECSCPHGQDGYFCKHLVAAGLTVLRQAGDIPRQRATAEAKARSLESWLEALPREDLLTLVRELLDLRGGSRYGSIEYADAPTYSGQVDEVVAVLDGLIDGGHSAEAASIGGHALSAVVEALEQADDSNGYIGGSGEALADAHARACAAAPAAPIELAGWLAGFVLGDGQAFPDFPADVYDDALGERGKAEYRRLITLAWRRNPSGWHEKYLMEELLRADGDVP